MTDNNLSHLSSFTRACLEAALWSSCDDTGEPLDAAFTTANIAPETIRQFIIDCTRFQVEHAALLASADLSLTQAGHDFWLTRNGHGSGFWDRDLGAIGEALTDAAHAFGEVDLYVGDDGLIHH